MEAANQVCGMAARKMFGLTHSTIQEMLLSRTPRFKGPSRRHADRNQSAGVGGMEADEDLVCGVLQASARLVQHPGSFACKLAELITIGHVRQCPKNQIRTHELNLLPDLSDWHCFGALGTVI